MIVVDHVYKSYGDVCALTDISFHVDKGELYGFIGPDGAGKTSLFRIIASLLLPDKGQVNMKSMDVVKEYRQIRKIIGYMPGQFSLYSDLTVLENLTFFATVFGTTIEANYALIREVYKQIEPYKNRLAGKLSGGMKQKLALSCALIHEPDVLILDEPTTGVDAVSRQEFWELLGGLKQKGITILVSTPYMDEASRCDRVSLIQDGTILRTEKPLEIIKMYDCKLYAIRSSQPRMLLDDVREYPSTETVFPFGQELHYTDKNDRANIREIKKFLGLKGHTDVEIAPTEPGIEDVFMRLTNKTGSTNKNE